EPVEASGRLGDLRHLGDSLRDKSGQLGDGQAGARSPRTTEPQQSPSRHPERAALHDVQPLLAGALGVAAGALLAALYPQAAEPPSTTPAEEPPKPPALNEEQEPMPRRSRPHPCP